MLTRHRAAAALLGALIVTLLAAAPAAQADPPVCLSWNSMGTCLIWCRRCPT